MTRFCRFFFLAASSAAVMACAAAPAHAGGMATEPILDNAIKETAVQPAPPPPAPPPVVAEAPPPAPAPPPLAKPKSFVFEPRLRVGEKYESNIFAADTGRKSDFITMVVPGLHMGLVNSPHKLDFDGEFELDRNLHHHEESQNNYKARLAGLLEAAKSLHFPFEVGFKRQHEERIDDLTHQGSVKPIHFTDFKTGLGVDYKPGPLGFALNGSFRALSYGDGEDAAGAPVIRRDADHNELGGEARVSYDIGAANTASLIGRLGRNDYDRNAYVAGGFTGPSRDSHSWGALAGWKTSFKGFLADLKLGLGTRNYKDGAIDDIRTLIGDANMHYDLTDATRLSLNASRFIHEDDEVLQGIVRTDAGLTLDHKLNDRLSLGAGAERQYWNFEASPRQDKVWKLKALADYMISQHFSLGAEYDYVMRASNAAGFDLNDNIVMVNLKGKL
jgi:hypothetical protein